MAVPPWLYLSCCVPPSDVDVSSFNAALKNKMLCQYVDSYGFLPSCNARSGATEPTLEQGRGLKIGTEPIHPSQANEPVAAFSSWVKWNDRQTLNEMKFSGVYLLALFENEPPSTVDPLGRQIVYIGETCENDLAGRLFQFNRSAFFGKFGHSGGISFSTRCSDSESKLFVSICGVSDIGEPMRSAFIRHTERRLLWDYVKLWRRRPICNSK
jgi:hypothetical protein